MGKGIKCCKKELVWAVLIALHAAGWVLMLIFGTEVYYDSLQIANFSNSISQSDFITTPDWLTMDWIVLT